jgi:hypothetical protein
MSVTEIIAQMEELVEKFREANAQEEDSRYFMDADGGVTEIVKSAFSETYMLKAVSGYNKGVEELASLRDTGNGFVAYFPTYSKAEQENYICMGYDEAAFLLKLLTHYDKLAKL